MYFSVFYGIYLFFFHYSADNEERLSLLTTSDDAFFSILLFFVGIFQYFSEFSVLFSISRYFSVFLRIFQYFRYFSVFFVFFSIFGIFCNFQYSADKEDILSLSTTRDDAAQDVFKKKEEDYCIVKLLHEYPIAFFLFFKFQKQEVSNVRLLSTLPPLSVT